MGVAMTAVPNVRDAEVFPPAPIRIPNQRSSVRLEMLCVKPNEAREFTGQIDCRSISGDLVILRQALNQQSTAIFR